MENISKPSLIFTTSMYGGGTVILTSLISWFIVLGAYPGYSRLHFYISNFIPLIVCILVLWLVNSIYSEKENQILPLSLIVMCLIISIVSSIYAIISAKKVSDTSKKN